MGFYGSTVWADTDPWTENQRLWAAAAVTANVVDWDTTRWATRHWNDQAGNSRETNRFLGDYPTTRQVDNYFLVLIPIELLIADQLPTAYRTRFLQIMTLVEVGAIANNTLRVGWRIEF
jgi:hypothetical protein